MDARCALYERASSMKKVEVSTDVALAGSTTRINALFNVLIRGAGFFTRPVFLKLANR